MFHPLG